MTTTDRPYILRFIPDSRTRVLPEPMHFATAGERDKLLEHWAEACENTMSRPPERGRDYEIEDPDTTTEGNPS